MPPGTTVKFGSAMSRSGSAPAGGSGFPASTLLIPADAAGTAWGQILRDGPAAGPPTGRDRALEWLRVEAAWPWFGVDFDENNLLMESLTADHVSFTKGCYVGQEVVIRVEHQGHLNKRLCGLVGQGATVPAPGSRSSWRIVRSGA